MSLGFPVVRAGSSAKPELDKFVLSTAIGIAQPTLLSPSSETMDLTQSASPSSRTSTSSSSLRNR